MTHQFRYNQPGYKFFVVNVNTISIDSGWEYREDALDRAVALKEEGGVPKVMTHPRVGAQVLDPNDDASWIAKRNNPGRTGRKFFGTEHEAREYLATLDEPREFQVRWRHIQDDFVVEPRNHVQVERVEKMEERNPRFGNPSEFYRTTFCNRTHRLSDGKPVEHNCYILDAKKLRLEAAGRMDEIIGSIVKEPRQEHKGVRASARLRKNPGELLVVNPHEAPDSAKAEKVFKLWHKKEPRNVEVFDTGCDGDDSMICVGKAHNIVYRSGKWEAGKKTNDYIHHFDSKPSVYMLEHLVEPLMRENPSKTRKSVESLLKRARNNDGQYAVADLASPLSFGLDDGTDEGTDIAIHGGSRVYGAVDQKTVIIVDPKWKIIVIRGGEMYFDERGIVK